MASAGFVHPGTGSHTERLHTQGNVRFSSQDNAAQVHVVLFVFFAPPRYHNFLHWGGVAGKEDQYQKITGKAQRKEVTD